MSGNGSRTTFKSIVWALGEIGAPAREALLTLEAFREKMYAFYANDPQTSEILKMIPKKQFLIEVEAARKKILK